jgi:RNA polymerase sigma-54 factor
MASQKLNLALKQSVNLTMALRQSIGILQMSHMELSELLSQELDKNPFLESSEPENSEEESDRYDYLPSRSSSENYDPLSGVGDAKSLSEYILEQIAVIITDKIEQGIAFYLLNLLGPNGYIDLDLDLASANLKCDEEKILTVLYKLQTMDPTGIWSRNLQECLTLQLKESGSYDSVFEIILYNLNMIANHDLSKLAKLCKVDASTIIRYVKHLKTLNPKPLSNFGAGFISSRIADVIVSVDTSGNINVKLNEEVSPKLSINKTYYLDVKSDVISSVDKEFITKEYGLANDLMRAIVQRSKTILAVAAAIVEKQKNFFLKGVMYLEPMTLADIALDCALNESTISRTTTNKYIQTANGIYEMKYFFTSHVAGKNSDVQISSTKVKEIIKTIIETEEMGGILSDDEIVSALTKFNISIARRTVAKYRESLGIETSSMRKRKMRALALV